MAEFLGDHVRDWAEMNVHNYPREDKASEVVRLVERLYGDVFKLGYQPKDINDLRVEVLSIIKERFELMQDDN